MNVAASSGDVNDVLEFAVSNGAEFAELFFENRQVCSILLEDSKAEKISKGKDSGFGIRIVNAGNTAYGYSNVISREEMMRLTRDVLDEVRRGKGNFILPGKMANGHVDKIVIPAESVSIEDKVAIAFAADRVARDASEEIAQVSIRYGDTLRFVEIFNSEGMAVGDERRQIVFSITVVASDGSDLQSAYRSVGGRKGYEFLSPELLDGLACEAVASAVRVLHAPRVGGGVMKVVLGSEAGGTMVHEAIGHGLEGDSVSKDQSVYSGRMGEKVASELVSVVDDATLEGRRGSYIFDDEGHPAERTLLVDKGVLKGYMHSRYSAERLKAFSTGNARRESFRHRPIVRMSNTMIAPLDSDPDSIISSVDNGLYVARMGGGQVDTSTGDFVFKVNEGYLIKNGKIGSPVRGATLIGNGPRILTQIDMVGNDLGFGIGSCGKDGQYVPVSDAQPTIRIPSITVGGEA
ncbi:TldD/PmbA family protein [bacterium]|nr:TldD/PmbA family protein [bacterium]